MNIELINGDCLVEMDKIADKSVNLILCDLPYGSSVCKWDTILPYDKLWKHYNRILADKGNIILFGTGLFAYSLALSNTKLFRYELIWQKSKCGSPFSAKYMPMKKHENILVFGNPAAVYNPQMTVGEPYKRKWTPNKINNMKFGIKGVETNNEGTRHPISILNFPQKWRRQDQVHPTQKPTELLEYLIKSYSNENDLVLDNCMGSGSTGVACINTNRNFIGIELNNEFFEIAKNRINNK